MELIPDISRREFVSTNVHYGYICASLDGEFNRDQNRVSRITSVQQLALLKCSKLKAAEGRQGEPRDSFDGEAHLERAAIDRAAGVCRQDQKLPKP